MRSEAPLLFQAGPPPKPTRFLILLIIQINLHQSKPTRLGFRVYTAEHRRPTIAFVTKGQDLIMHIVRRFYACKQRFDVLYIGFVF